jgi:hypothetical protein
VGFVGQAGVGGCVVGIGVAGDAAQPGVAAGPDDPYGDFAAVGHQYRPERMSSDLGH